MHVNLKISLKQADSRNSRTAWDIFCDVTSLDGSDPNVFVILVLPKNALNLSTDRFSHVADLVDMLDYPDKKDIDTAYYRVSSIQLRVRSLFQALRTIQNIKSDVRLLVRAANYMNSPLGILLVVNLSF